MSQQAEQNARSAHRRPLRGCVVAVTRPEPRAGEMSRRLRELGAEPLECPAIRLRDPADLEPLRRAASRLEAGGYDWLVFTSPAGVHQLRRLSGGDPGRGGATVREGPPVAAIGSSTAAAAREAGFRVEVVPEQYRAEALAEAVRRAAGSRGPSEGGDPMAGQRVLLPRAAEARDVLPRALEDAGAAVDEVPAYRAVRPDEGAMDALVEAVARRRLDWVTFTASSIVRSYVDRVGAETGGARVAAIGPITADTARALGLGVDVVAEEYTVEGLLDALVRAEESTGTRETG